MPLSQASQGTYDAQGRTLFCTRFDSKVARPRKRYQGGGSTGPKSLEVRGRTGKRNPLTSRVAGTSKDAMWWNGRVYFVSDRDGTMNHESHGPSAGRNLKQLHPSSGFGPREGARALPGTRGLPIWAICVYDIASRADKAINIELSLPASIICAKHWIKMPLDYVTAMHLSHDGGSIMAASRGRASPRPCPWKNGRLVDYGKPRNLGRYHLRCSHVCLPDGKSLLAPSYE